MREFDFDREFVAADDLVYGGKRYAGGERFDRKALGVSDGDLWDLWVMGRIDAMPAGYAPVDAKPAASGGTDLSDAELERLTAPARPPTKSTTPPRR